jgi:hypothetical protein
MAKRTRTWEPDIYDMAAARAARVAAVTPPGPTITDLAVAAETADATEALVESEPALDEAVVTAAAMAAAQPTAPRSRARRNDNSTLIGLVAGALAGAALGLLAAPASGDALRQQLRATAESRTQEVARQVETVAQNVPHTMAARADPSTAEERNRS